MDILQRERFRNLIGGDQNGGDYYPEYDHEDYIEEDTKPDYRYEEGNPYDPDKRTMVYDDYTGYPGTYVDPNVATYKTGYEIGTTHTIINKTGPGYTSPGLTTDKKPETAGLGGLNIAEMVKDPKVAAVGLLAIGLLLFFKLK